MDEGQWNRQEESTENSSVYEEPPQIIDPLAELAADLALCEIALEEGRGAFCDDCDCTFGFHCSMDNGVCELCGCLSVYHTARKDLTYMPHIEQGAPRRYDWYSGSTGYVEAYDRDKAAREVLRELSE